MVAAGIIRNLGLCLFAVFATLLALGYVAWLLLVSAWQYLVFRFNYGWKAEIIPRKWL